VAAGAAILASGVSASGGGANGGAQEGCACPAGSAGFVEAPLEGGALS
jgi:hypothetical protein